VVRADVPEVLPVLLGMETDVGRTGYDNLVSGINLAGEPQQLLPLGYVPRLPRLHAQGVVMDLTLAQRLSAYRGIGLVTEVWLTDEAPAGTADRLRRAGVLVLDRTTTEQRLGELDAEGGALSLLLLLAAAGAAVVLATAGLATVANAQARRRAYEMAALRSTGIAPRTLRAGVLCEYAVLLGLGAAAGVGAGLASVSLSLDILPLSTGQNALPVPEGPHWGPLLVLGAALLVALAGTAYVMTRRLLHMSRPALLREAQA
jgi:hypothetical protein